MKSQNASKLLGQIDLTMKNISSFTNASKLEMSYLAKFLVVFICGIYEEIIETLVNEMVKKTNNPYVYKFISNSLRKYFRNPNIAKIAGLLGDFNTQWKEEIKNLPDDVKTALDNIYTNKNGIAHGDTINITFADVCDFYGKSKAVIEKIDDLLL